jgi:hypothetical protein
MKFLYLIGTTAAYLKIGLSGVRLKKNSGNLSVRNNGDSADAEITVSKANVSGDSIAINSDSVGSGADWKYTLTRPASGMTADVALTLPIDDGTPNQVLSTDGNGVMSWASSSSTASSDKIDTTNLNFGDTPPLAMFSTGAADVITKVQIIVDTAFNGTAPVVSIGVSGTTSKYVATSQVDLKTAGIYEVTPGVAAAGIEALIATYVADGSTVGASRILTYYATPS